GRLETKDNPAPTGAVGPRPTPHAPCTSTTFCALMNSPAFVLGSTPHRGYRSQVPAPGARCRWPVLASGSITHALYDRQRRPQPGSGLRRWASRGAFTELS